MEITPEMLPIDPIVRKKMVAHMIKEKMTHFSLVKCGRFGGVCRSKHPECIQFRTRPLAQ